MQMNKTTKHTCATTHSINHYLQTLLAGISLLFILLAYTPTLSADEWIYTTRPGDTIWDISKKHLKSVSYWSKVQQHNQVDIAKHLSPGTRLRIPVEWLKAPVASASVISVTGSVQIKAIEGEARNLISKQALKVGDSIITGENSSALIQFADSSTLLIQQNSQVIFNTISSFGSTGMVDTRIRLQQGRIETAVKPLRSKASRYEITTPAAVAAVRGTQFRVAYNADESTMGSEVTEGNIDVTAQQQSTSIDNGFGNVTAEGSTPGEPVRLLQAPEIYIDSKTPESLPYTFTWEALYGASEYRILLSPKDAPDTLAYEFTSQLNRLTLEQVADNNYLVKVRGIDKLGLEGFNGQNSLSIDNHVPQLVTQLPAHGAELNALPYEFEWQASDKIAKYHFQLSKNSDFKHIVFDYKGEQNTLSHQKELSPGTYYWRVAAIDDDGVQGKYSETRELTVSESPYAYLKYLLFIIPLLLL